MTGKRLASASLALWLLLPAGTALASIDDQAHALTTGDRTHLEQDLAGFGQHHFDVVIVKHLGGSIAAFTKRLFDQHHLTDRDGLITVSIRDHKVDVHLGRGFTDRGVDSHVISAHLQSDFVPEAKAGHLPSGLRRLAQGLMGASRPLAVVATQKPVPTSQPVAAPHHTSVPKPVSHAARPVVVARPDAPSTDTGPNPLTALLLLAVIGGACWGVLKTLVSYATLPSRLDALEARFAKVVSYGHRLDDAELLGRFRSPETEALYGDVVAASATSLSAAGQIGEDLKRARELKANGRKLLAHSLARRLDGKIDVLGLRVGEALMALEQLEGTVTISRRVPDEGQLTARLRRRLAELQLARAELLTRAGDKHADPASGALLERCEALLAGEKVNHGDAERWILEATDALDAFRQRLEPNKPAERRGTVWRGLVDWYPYLLVKDSLAARLFDSYSKGLPAVPARSSETVSVVKKEVAAKQPKAVEKVVPARPDPLPRQAAPIHHIHFGHHHRHHHHHNHASSSFFGIRRDDNDSQPSTSWGFEPSSDDSPQDSSWGSDSSSGSDAGASWSDSSSSDSGSSWGGDAGSSDDSSGSDAGSDW